MSNARDLSDLLPIQSSDIKSALNASGSAPVYACRAWVHFDGVAINGASENTSCITGGEGITSISERSAIITSYALCGFANFGSIGIQLGGVGGMAPKRRKDLSKLALKSMIGGALASWLTATIAGILI